MGALVFSALGAAVGGVLGPLGTIAGRALGAVAGGVLDAALFGGGSDRQGPRLSDLDITAASDGTPIPRLYGRARLTGQIIWGTRLEEVATTRKESGGKGGAKTTEYDYFANIAVGLCEGPVGHVKRIWADGEELDQTGLTIRIHTGAEDQPADPLIAAIEGDAPAYRGTAYVVFERLPLAAFGNRVPQLSFEVIRPVGRLEPMIRALCLIPGATEHGYDTQIGTRDLGLGSSAPETAHTKLGLADIEVSLDEACALCPNLQRVALVTTWFGDDLRAGECTIRPAVENRDKRVTLEPWRVAGETRETAMLVSGEDGRPAFGGTPSDASVIGAIAAIRARGLAVTFYPFVMMDVPPGNALADPLTGTAPQPAFPWRGRITCDPAPGRPGTVDGTGAAAAQVGALFGVAAPGDFSVSGATVDYTGPDEWTLRRMVLHYAHLCVAAGGVEAFLIGSEFVGLTRVRGAAGYPAVDRLVALAEDVRAILGLGTKISYAADWTEYGAHVLEGGAELRFPLDPLWASPAVDMVAIDQYAPLTDWRDGDHADAALAETIYDLDYLRSRVTAGEAFDFYYASDADRAAGLRQPITDGAYGKPWVFRPKDLAGWWGNAHVERAGGVETAATAWVPQSKPIWLTELGVGAVDKGPNRPSVFPDAKSSESGLPPFSNGARDDLIQRRALEASLSSRDPEFGASLAENPVSPSYGGRMIDPSATHLWAFDARPFPVFPNAPEVWADAANWETGHWLNGRLGGLALGELVEAIAADYDIADCDVSALAGSLDGAVIDRPMSARDAIEPLASAWRFAAVEAGAGLAFVPFGAGPETAIDDDLLVADESGALVSRLRAQESEIPSEIAIAFSDGRVDYRRLTATSRRLVGGSRRQSKADLAVVSGTGEMQRRADIWLQDLWVGRETLSLALPPSTIALGPGDLIRVDGVTALVTTIVEDAPRRLEARRIAPEVFALARPADASTSIGLPAAFGPPLVVVMDLPVLGEEAGRDALTYVAASARPWPGPLAIWRSGDGAGYRTAGEITRPALVGETAAILPPGPLWRFDRANTLLVDVSHAALFSVDAITLLAGANAAAIETPSGAWEIVQFATATLVGPLSFALTDLLRGQRGTEAAMQECPAGSRFVLLDGAIQPLVTSRDDLGLTVNWRIGPASRDHADPAVTGFTHAASDTALKALAPVHLGARRTEAGIAIAWMRRTRRAGGSWDAEPPLAEDREAYRVEILDGPTVIRSYEATSPGLTYTNADETADFGGPQAGLTVAVAQIGATGPGRRAVKTIAL